MRHAIPLLLLTLIACGPGPKDKMEALGRELCSCIDHVKTHTDHIAYVRGLDSCRQTVAARMDTSGLRAALAQDTTLHRHWRKATACLQNAAR